MATKKELAVGQRVRFRRSHDPSTVLTGHISAISEDDPNDVTVETEEDGHAVELSRQESTHASHCTPIDDDDNAEYQTGAAPEDPATPLTDHQLAFLANKGYSPDAGARMAAGLSPKARAKFNADAKAWKEPTHSH